MRKGSRLILALISPVLWSATAWSAEPPRESRTRVATILSEPIFADQLAPRREEAQEQANSLSKEQYEKWLLNFRRERLTMTVFDRLMDRYCREHACEPTEEEVQEFLNTTRLSEGSKASLTPLKEELLKELRSPNTTQARKDELTRQLQNLEYALTSPQASWTKAEYDVAWQTVRTWKFNKTVYDQFGGAVIWQQMGLEPLGAYQTWLEEQERAGNFQILDAQLRAAFWEYFSTSPVHNEVNGESLREMGLKHPFEKPWWRLKKEERRSKDGAQLRRGSTN